MTPAPRQAPGDEETKGVASSGESTRKLARLAKNSVANLFRLCASWMIILVLPPVLVRSLTPAAYATWMLILQIGAYATLLDGGLQLAVGRFVARANHADDHPYLSSVVSSATLLLSGGAVVMLTLIAFVALHLDAVFPSIPASILPQARLALFLVGGSLSIAFPCSVLAGFYLGLEKNHVNALAGVLSRIVGASGTVWAALHHQGLSIMAAWTSVGTLTQPLLFVLASRRHDLSSLFRPHFVSLRMTVDFAKFCSATLVSQLSMLLITGLDLPIVVAYDFSNASYYAVAVTMSNMMVVPQGAILSTIVPMMSTMGAGGDRAERNGRVLLRTTRLATIMLALMTVPLMIGMQVILRVWVGSYYAQRTLLFGELLVIAQLIRLTLMPYTLIAFSMGQQGRTLISPVIESLVNLVASLALARSMGAAGVALGTLLGALIGVTLHFVESMPRTTSMIFSRVTLLWTGILQPLGIALVPAALIALLSAESHILGKSALVCACSAILAVIYWNYQLEADDRLAFRRLADQLMRPRSLSKRAEV